MNPLRLLSLILLVGLAVAGLSSLIIIDQTEQALVLRLGSVRETIREPGLYFRIPVIDSVIVTDKRILDLDTPEQTVTSAGQPLRVDAFTRYRITDPLLFYQTVNNDLGARLRLSSIVNAAIRDVIAASNLEAVVRTGREAIMNRIQEEVNRQAKGLGVEIVDVRLTRVNLPEQNSQKVFERMTAERERLAADHIANGKQLEATIKANADREVAIILGEANRQAEELRGHGDAERARLLAAAFGKDAEFSRFWRSMQAYENVLKSGDRLVMSPETSEFLSYLNNQGLVGNRPAPAQGK
jgi:membrane protease subunit HflC